MNNSRLGAMMFLQYALWGAWLPVTARYLSAGVSEGGLGFSGSQIGMILGLAGSIGAILLHLLQDKLQIDILVQSVFFHFLLFQAGW